MGNSNQTAETSFILFAFSDLGEYQILLFVVFLFAYILILLGNTVFSSLIVSNAKLHTPMYYLLSCLSVVDICSTSTTMPNLLINLIQADKTISFSGCFVQMFFNQAFAVMCSFLLTVMAYDRYVAVCRPLHYTMVMSKNLCIDLLLGSWFITCPHCMLYTIWAYTFTYCGSREIYHFFCDVPLVCVISCSDLSNIMFVSTIEVPFFLFRPLIYIAISYFFITTSIMKMATTLAKQKTFSTCSSHFFVIILFYGATLSVYVAPEAVHPADYDRIACLLYTMVTPMLNPVIYTLRNKEVKEAFRKVLSR